MERDSIVTEVRAAREAYAAQFGFDLRAMARDLREQEQAGGRVLVSFPPKPPRFDGPVTPPAEPAAATR